MNPPPSIFRQKLSNGFVLFTAIWSSVIMPMAPSYAKMLDPDELPSLGSELLQPENNTERFLAEHSKTVGRFLSEKKNAKDLAEMAQDYLRNEATNKATTEIEGWLSKAGKANLRLDIDKSLSIKNSQLDWLIPWYDKPDMLLFTQHSIHRTDGRLLANKGIGLRQFNQKSMVGVNAFFDHDLSRYHSRVGLGAEYWQDYLKLSANSYIGISAWRSAAELSHDFNARPAKGWDLQAEGWLPAYPNLGANIKVEQYFGDDVALFGQDQRQKNPIAGTVGVNWTPYPILTLNADHKLGNGGLSETQAKIEFTWTLGKTLAEHFDPSKVGASRRLSGSRYDLVDRNNNIILEYQQKTQIRLSLPEKIQGETGQELKLVKSFTSKYPLDKIIWQAPELLSAGGSISPADHTARIKLPSYKTAATPLEKQKLNRYRLRAVAYDNKGNASPSAETLIVVSGAGLVGIKSEEMTSQGKGIANGVDINRVNAQVRDAYGHFVQDAKVTFILPPELALATQKKKSASPQRSALQQKIMQKMQAMRILTPWEHHVITDSKGEAQVNFTSQQAGDYVVSVSANNGASTQTRVTFQSDVSQAHINPFVLLQNGAIADGKATNKIKLRVTDTHGNSIANATVSFKANQSKIGAQGITDADGYVEMTLTSVVAGSDEITATTNNDSQKIVVNFVNGKLATITIKEVTKTEAGANSSLTIKLTDEKGNIVSGADGTVMVTIGNSQVPVEIKETHAGSGEYTGTLPGQLSGSHSVTISTAGVTSAQETLTVEQPKPVKPTKNDGSGTQGALGVADKVEIIKTDTSTGSQSGGNATLTIKVTDAFGNGLSTIDTNKINVASSQGNVTGWKNNGDGTYTAEIPLTHIGNDTITATVNGHKGTSSTIKVEPTTNIKHITDVKIIDIGKPDAGATSEIKVVLKDNNANPVKGVTEITVNIDGKPTQIPVIETKPGSGEYIGTLPPQQTGTPNVTVSVNGQDSASKPLTVKPPKPVKPTKNDGSGTQGAIGVANKVEIIKTDTTAGSQSGGTATVIIKITDAFGNGLPDLNTNEIKVTSGQGNVTTWTDNKDGTYTAKIPLTTLGKTEIKATVNGNISAPSTIKVEPATGTDKVKNVEIVKIDSVDAGVGSTIMVNLTDNHKNPITGVTEITVNINGQPTQVIVKETKPGSGEYIGTLPPQQTGTPHVTVSVNGQDSASKPLIVKPPKPVKPTKNDGSGTQGAIGVANKVEIIKTDTTAGSQSGGTATVIIKITDAFGNGLPDLNTNEIKVTSGQGNVTTWTDNKDGTYTAEIPLTTLGKTEIKATVNGNTSAPSSIKVEPTTNIKHITNVTITDIGTPDAGATSQITVALKDNNNHPVVGVQQITVNIGGVKTQIPVTETVKDSGIYTGQITGQQHGSHIITASVGAVTSQIGSTTLTVNPSKPVTSTNKDGSGVSGTQGVIAKVGLAVTPDAGLKSNDDVTLTVTLEDSFSNKLTNVNLTAIVLTHKQSTQTLKWTDKKDGKYTTTLKLTKLGADTLTATANNLSSNAVAIDVGNAIGVTSITDVKIIAVGTPDAGATSEITVELKDINGHPVVAANGDVSVTIDKQPATITIAETTTKGTYIGTILGQQVGSHEIKVTVNGIDSTSTTKLIVKPATSIQVIKSGKPGERGTIQQVELTTSNTATLKSNDVLTLTVTLKDAFNNTLIGVAPNAIDLAHQQGTPKLVWTDNQDGTYTTKLTLTKLDLDSLTVKANNVSSQPVAITVAAQSGKTAVKFVELISGKSTLSAGETTTLTLTLMDEQKNGVVKVNIDDIRLEKNDLWIRNNTLGWNESGNGIYTTDIQLTELTTQSLKVQVNNLYSNKADVMVSPVKDVAKVTNIKFSVTPNQLSAGDSVTLKLELLDTLKNGVVGITADKITINDDLTKKLISGLIWKDEGAGVYTTSTSINKIGAHSLKATVNSVDKSQVINVKALSGKTHVTNAALSIADKDIFASGKTTLTVKLTDTNSNGVVGASDILLTDSIDGATAAVLNAVWKENTFDFGTYTTDITLYKVGSHSIHVTAGSASNIQSITVKSQTGSQAVASIDMAKIAASDAGADGLLSISLKDANGNIVNNVLSQDIKVEIAGNSTPVVLTEQGSKGIYTGKLPAQKSGTYAVKVTIGKVVTSPANWVVNNPASIAIASFDKSGQRGALDSAVLTGSSTAGSGDQVTLTLTLTDKFGNLLTDAKSKLAVNTALKVDSLWKDNSNGTYTATLLMDKLGAQSITATVDRLLSNPIDIKVTPLNGANHVQTSALSLDDTELEAGKATNLTLSLTDSVKNGVIGVKDAEISLTNNQAKSWISTTDGVYTTTHLFETVGQYQWQAVVNGKKSAIQTIDVTYPKGSSVVKDAKLVATQKTINAGGNVDLELTLKDKYGNKVIEVQNDIVLTDSHSAETISQPKWTSSSTTPGVYKASVPLKIVNRHTLTATVNSQPAATKEITVNALQGSSNVTSVNITAKPTSISAGESTELTVTLKDAFTNGVISVADVDIVLTDNSNALTQTIKWNNTGIDGVYTAKVQLDKVGAHTLKVTVNGEQNDKLVTVNPLSGSKHVNTVNLTSNSSSIVAGEKAQLSATLQDRFGNGVVGVVTTDMVLADSLVTQTTQPTWTEGKNGVYIADVPLNLIGKHALTATVNNNVNAPALDINATNPSGKDKVASAIIATNVMSIDAGQNVELTLTLKDQYGNSVINVQNDIALVNSNSKQSLSKATWSTPSDGVYKTTVPLTLVGKHTLTATVNNKSYSSQEITVNALTGIKSVNSMKLIATEDSILAGSKTTLTLTLLDSYNNEVAGVLTSDIKFKNTDSLIQTPATWSKSPSSVGTFTTDVQLDKVKQHTLEVKVGTNTKTVQIEVKPLTGATNVAKIEFASISAIEVDANTQLILTLKDTFGNGVVDVKSSDITLTNDNASQSVSWTKSKNGQYAAQLPLTKVGKNELQATVNNHSASVTAVVNSPSGIAKVTSMTVTPSLSKNKQGDYISSPDQSFTLALQLNDKHGNGVKGVKSTEVNIKNNSQLSAAVLQEDVTQAGRYSANVQLTKVGKQAIETSITQTLSVKTEVKVEPSTGNQHVSKLELSSNQSRIMVGDNIQLTLKHFDKFDNAVDDINTSKIHILYSHTSNNLAGLNWRSNGTTGEYTATVKMPDENVHGLTPSLDGKVTGPKITIEVIALKPITVSPVTNPHTFPKDSGFPTTGFDGAKFKISVPSGKASDYNWSVDEDWLSVDGNGIVTMIRKPITRNKGNAMHPLITATPKNPSSFAKVFKYDFTLEKWFTSHGQRKYSDTKNICQNSSLLATNDDLILSDTDRKVGALSNEWRQQTNFSDSAWTSTASGTDENLSGSKVDTQSVVYISNGMIRMHFVDSAFDNSDSYRENNAVCVEKLK